MPRWRLSPGCSASLPRSRIGAGGRPRRKCPLITSPRPISPSASCERTRCCGVGPPAAARVPTDARADRTADDARGAGGRAPARRRYGRRLRQRRSPRVRRVRARAPAGASGRPPAPAGPLRVDRARPGAPAGGRCDARGTHAVRARREPEPLLRRCAAGKRGAPRGAGGLLERRWARRPAWPKPRDARWPACGDAGADRALAGARVLAPRSSPARFISITQAPLSTRHRSSDGTPG